MEGIELPAENPGPEEMGPRAEALAAEFLKERGWRIVARNERTKLGEIDLVGLGRISCGQRMVRCLTVVEVKSRRVSRRGAKAEARRAPPPEANVTAEKRQRLIRLARQFVKQNRLRIIVRFDVIAVEFGGEATQLRHHPAAFDADG